MLFLATAVVDFARVITAAPHLQSVFFLPIQFIFFSRFVVFIFRLSKVAKKKKKKNTIVSYRSDRL